MLPSLVMRVQKDTSTIDVHTSALYSVAGGYVVVACIIMLIQPFLSLDCDYKKFDGQDITFGNGQYVYDPCRSIPQWKLLWLTIDQCDMGRRLVAACVLGSIIGWERRAPDRPAGIRTMSLVSLGSCLFTLCSTYAFLSGPMEWDAARVAAAIPSGVGFIGSALIFKHTTTENNAWHEVHGLSTAASVWLAAAVGIACAGSMYFVASFTTSIILVLLRFGPRTKCMDGDDDDEEKEDEDSDVVESGDSQFVHPAIKEASSYSFFTADPELQPIMSSSKRGNVGRGELQKGLSKRSLRPSLM